MKILVTGGCGFIGSNFLNLAFEELRFNYEPRLFNLCSKSRKR